MVSGKKVLFEGAENFGQFDMAEYEQARGMDFCLLEASVIARGQDYDRIKEGLLCIRERLSGVYSKVFDEDEAGVLDAMVLGDRTSLPREIKGLYRRNGLGHALSISGLHIGIIGCGLYGLLRKFRLNRYTRTAISIFVMLLYCVMTGSPLSAVRAFIMFALGLYADICKRTYDMLSAMALSMMILLTAQPMRLYEAGFWLSYGAVTGAGVLHPHVEKLFGTGNKILSSLLFCLSLSVFTFPITAYFFYQLPLYGTFLNLLVIPLLGPLLFAALITAAVGAVCIKAAYVPAMICKFILFLIERGCSLWESLPSGIIVTGKPELWRIALFYAGILSLLLLTPKIRAAGLKRTVNILGIAALIGLQFVRHDNKLELTMLSVGQGQCIYFRSPEGVTCLYDCGSTSEKSIGEYRVEPFLKASGRASIDYCIVSHTDEDHISGFLELFENNEADALRIGSLILPDIGNPDEAYMQLAAEAAGKGAKVYKVSAGDSFSFGNVAVRCLNPEKGVSFEDKNTYSCVLELRYENFSALLTGDVQEEGEENAFKGLGTSYSVLQAAHHGSKNSTPMEFLEKARPGIVIISAGRDNRYNHPHAETIERLKTYTDRIYVTKDVGAITIRSDGKNMSISTFISKEE